MLCSTNESSSILSLTLRTVKKISLSLKAVFGQKKKSKLNNRFS